VRCALRWWSGQEEVKRGRSRCDVQDIWLQGLREGVWESESLRRPWVPPKAVVPCPLAACRRNRGRPDFTPQAQAPPCSTSDQRPAPATHPSSVTTDRLHTCPSTAHEHAARTAAMSQIHALSDDQVGCPPLLPPSCCRELPAIRQQLLMPPPARSPAS
jgi:hypothetical protein